MRSIKALLIGYLFLQATSPGAWAAPTDSAASVPAPLPLSPVVLDLFRAEMRALLLGTQAIASALPTGDWNGIVTTSRQMKASYVLEKKLTPAQEKEIAALPERFKELDQSFHARTERLAEAATRRDYEAAAYQYARLLETCVACHISFAHARFPTLGAPLSAEHQH